MFFEKGGVAKSQVKIGLFHTTKNYVFSVNATKIQLIFNSEIHEECTSVCTFFLLNIFLNFVSLF